MHQGVEELGPEPGGFDLADLMAVGSDPCSLSSTIGFAKQNDCVSYA